MAKLLAALLAVASAVPGVANAATGNINGTYTIHYTALCQSIQKEMFTTVGTSTTDQDQQTQIQTIDNGQINETIGYMKFVPVSAGALSGTLTANFTGAKGSLAILGLPGGGGNPGSPAAPDMQIGTQTKTGTYSVTLGTGMNSGSLTVTFSGQSPATFTLYVSQLLSGIYKHADFINISPNGNLGPSCAQTGVIDRY